MSSLWGWLKEKRRLRELSRLRHEWRHFVWEWCRPYQLETIQSRGPFREIVERERGRQAGGLPVDRDALRAGWATIVRGVTHWEDRVGAAVGTWLASEEGAEWRTRIDGLGERRRFLVDVGEVVTDMSFVTLAACQAMVKDMMSEAELGILMDAITRQENALIDAVRAIRQAEQNGTVAPDPRSDSEIRESIREMWDADLAEG